MALAENFPVVDMGSVPESPDVMPQDRELLLANGRKIWLMNLNQYRTYGGLLCGIPFDPDADVERALVRARDWDNGFHLRPIIVPATIVRGERPPPAIRRHPGAPTGPRPWAFLPAVTSFGVFQSDARKDGNGCFASALVIWWQGHFGIPRDPGVLEAFLRMDWDNHVEEWDP